jgi:hypothetical protein
VNLGYADYRTINPEEWAGREAEGILLVRHAGEMLYRSEALDGAGGGTEETLADEAAWMDSAKTRDPGANAK